ncbi:MAG: hypothetical protein JXR83_17930 [Deltaproteobacteria bacterium]|nr:hypothetical protein [Deltaproteobacteria bacterium]
MALPPEPIEELLPEATLVIEAAVAEVIEVGPRPPKKKAPKGFTSTGQQNASQRVLLEVKRVLKGALPKAGATRIEVKKPVGAYTLRRGSAGAFLLRDDGRGLVILGRYGPDTYTVRSVEATLAAQGSGPAVRRK